MFLLTRRRDYNRAKALTDVFTRLKWTSCRILELSKNQVPYLTEFINLPLAIGQSVMII